MPSVIERNLAPELASLMAKILRAYFECSAEVQRSIRDMLEVVNSEDSDDEERQAALHTIGEALFPVYHDDGPLGVDAADLNVLAAENQADGQQALSEVEAEEERFAARLRDIMEVKAVSQTELARRAAVGQSAISMMLSRDCRPQNRTVRRLAEALGVAPEELWPGS